jgi:hypothetical protein
MPLAKDLLFYAFLYVLCRMFVCLFVFNCYAPCLFFLNTILM